MVIASGAFTYVPNGADWARILPELVMLATALLVLLADLAIPANRRGWLAYLGLLGVIGAALATGVLYQTQNYHGAFFDMVTSDRMALLADMIVLFAVGLGLLYSPGYIERQGIRQQGEYYALMLLAAFGMMFMASAGNLMIIFVGLEILSLSLYILSAYIVGRSRSQEAGLKYFILSSFASGFLLYGMALTYGATGSTSLAGIRAFLGAHSLVTGGGFGPLLLAGIGLMAVGFCFKVSAIPFQAWTPDVYVGAPTSVTAFMSAGTKVAAFVAFARVFVVALHPVASQWTPALWLVAVITMIGGNIMAVASRDVKRMLAYSSVANAGYLLVAIVTDTQLSLASLLVFLAAYAAMNVGAFGVVLAIERNSGLGTTLDDFAGMARRRPWLAFAMLVFLCSLAGVPATVGFAGKWYIFYAAIVGGHLELAIIGLVSSVLGMFYYLRVVWAMYFTEARPTTTASASAFAVTPAAVEPATIAASGGFGVAVAEPRVATAPAIQVAGAPAPSGPSTIPAATIVALGLAVALTIALGIVPGGLYHMATEAARALLP
ncbi:MAG TPA: NADH-quinone oxidoreductase subunit NuoN [Ktedonobacterales bacterium]|nr:NADH-quinone oxidoreductase subunit NuoN [Ktedonobacterales bacterium]